MSSTFPHARRSRQGYDVDEVEQFLADARSSYLAEPGAREMSSDDIRTTGFTLRKGGYATEHVDAALARLEDAFAGREKQRALAADGDKHLAEARDLAQVILDRLVRPHHHRFRRTSLFTVGYAPVEVDAFVDRIAEYLQGGEAVTADEIREVAFRPKRGGYDETQVDVVLDAMVDVILAVR
ncbi:DivIVA domain-containing protein [Schumannella sp. 10F1B-5-1]|uniref:DivIVA domain-containing protein n=1 Tax=Schumannella sp. 10F1B-5-1 TaxID=2590780 RepID=UPI001131FF75|nr:DivIVA domain-containing protein [Schumannella sp. 10F1B-5-1]TPW72369.1 DivIVA domain-containing protein [Schumannella sp. 10F1B-5-1]